MSNNELLFQWNDEDWIKKDFQKEKNVLGFNKDRLTSLSTAGCPLLNDVDYIVNTEEDLLEHNDDISVDKVVWLTNKTDGTWDVKKKVTDNKYVSMKYPTVEKLFSTPEFVKVYNIKDNFNDYYTSVEENEIKAGTNLYFDKNLEKYACKYGELTKPEYNGNIKKYVSGKLYKVKVCNTVFETQIPEKNVNKDSIFTEVATQRNVTYSNLLLKYTEKKIMTFTLRIKYPLNAIVNINGSIFTKDSNNVILFTDPTERDYVINKDGQNVTEKHRIFWEVTVNCLDGDIIEWKVYGDNCETVSGTETMYHHNDDRDSVSKIITLKLKNGSTLFSTTETGIEYNNIIPYDGVYRVLSTGAGGGAGGGSTKNGGFWRGHAKHSSGDGGGSGATYNGLLQIRNVNSNKGLRFTAQSGAGGIGGTADKSAGNIGHDGESSKISIVDLSNNKLIFNLVTEGGSAGSGGRNKQNQTRTLKKPQKGGSVAKYYDYQSISFIVDEEFIGNNGNNSNGGESVNKYVVNDKGQYYIGQGGSGVWMKNGESGLDGYVMLAFTELLPNQTFETILNEQNTIPTQKDILGLGYSSYYSVSNDYVYFTPTYEVMTINERPMTGMELGSTLIEKGTDTLYVWTKNSLGNYEWKKIDSMILYSYDSQYKKYNLENGNLLPNYLKTTTSFYRDVIRYDYKGIDDELDKLPTVNTDEKYHVNDVYYFSKLSQLMYVYKIDDSGVIKWLEYNGTNSVDYRLANVGSFISLDNELCTYQNIKPTYLSEPAWSSITPNGVYEIVSGNVSYYTEKSVDVISDDTILYIDNKLSRQAIIIKTSETKSGSYNISRDFLKYGMIKNVVKDNLVDCYELSDGNEILYTSDNEKILNDNSLIYQDSELTTLLGRYYDYCPHYTKTEKTVYGYETLDNILYSENHFFDDLNNTQPEESEKFYKSPLLQDTFVSYETYFIKTKEEKILLSMVNGDYVDSIYYEYYYELDDEYYYTQDVVLNDDSIFYKNNNGYVLLSEPVKYKDIKLHRSGIVIGSTITQMNTISFLTNGIQVNRNEEYDEIYNNEKYYAWTTKLYAIYKSEQDNIPVEEALTYKDKSNDVYDKVVYIQSEPDFTSYQGRRCVKTYVGSVYNKFMVNKGFINVNNASPIYDILTKFNLNPKIVYTKSKYPEIGDVVYQKSDNGIIELTYTYVQTRPVYGLIHNTEEIYNDYDYVFVGNNIYDNYHKNDYVIGDNEVVHTYFNKKKNDIFYITNDVYATRNKNKNGQIYSNDEENNSYYITENDEYGWFSLKYRVKNKYDVYNIESYKPDISKIESIYLVNDKTNETITDVQLFDPLQGVFPNNVIDYIDYVTPFDPVGDYTDNASWGKEKLGTLWFDISKVRYVDYYQGDIDFRRSYWGKQVGNSEICIMEWTRSVNQPLNISYIKKSDYISSLDKMVDYYYYWVKNPTNINENSERKLSAFAIANIINNPTEQGIVWGSPIFYDKDMNKSSFMICNFDEKTMGGDFVIQINYNKYKHLDKFVDWVLIKENDKKDIPEFLWDKMEDSLVGKDKNLEVVPDASLAIRNKYGISNYPRQSMFKDKFKARQVFAQVMNELIKETSVVLENNQPNKNSYVYEVNILDELTNMTIPQSLIDKNVLVKVDRTFDKKWVIYKINSSDSFSVIDYQKYNYENYVDYYDWYKEEKYQNIGYNYITNNLNNLHVSLKDGDIIRVDKDKWEMYEYNDGNYILVGREKGLPQFNSNLYQNTDEMSSETYITLDNGEKISYKNVIESEIELIIKDMLSIL